MAGLQLTRGGESRLEGAPYQDLPDYAAYVDAVAARLLAEDTDGLLANDREMARERARLIVNAELDAEQQKRAEAQARVTEDYGRRQQDRAQARGVVPESLPADEYGGVSARTVRDANMSPEEQDASISQYQGLVDAEIRDLREGRFHGAAAQARQYEQDYGLPTTPSSTGKTDLDYLREQQAHQGFLRTGRGEMIPMGPAPTPESLASRRGFDEWANETPGTERQALYNPAGYEEFREGVRNDIRDGARADEAMYGTGSDDQLKDAADRGNRMAVDQYNNRQARRQSEERVRNAQRGRFYEDKLMVDAGVMPPPPAPGAGIQELERAAFRGRYARRQAELDRRKQNRIDQAMMAGGQPTGGAFGTRAATTAINQLGPGWREIALLDRLTNGRVGGPTPLGVDAVGAQSAFRMMQGMELGQGFLNNPAVQQQVQNAQLQQQANVLADAEDHVNTNYAWNRGWMGASSFTAAEQQQTVNYLMNKYGPPAGRMTLAQAQAIVDDIAARKVAEPAAPPPPLGDFGAPPMM